jgi:mRNA-degrading endonuclease RelE of RelBE toxin-antitoxin system
MRYEVEWSAPARRALQQLPERAATAVVEFVYGGLAENPARVGHPLRWELDGVHAARRGDYQVVYRIDDHRAMVTVEAIAHRSDVYRRRRPG